MNKKEVLEFVKRSTLLDVVNFLAKLGSDEDPIVWNGVETTPRDLICILNWEYTPVESIRISFYGERNGKLAFRKRSTFAQMIMDRLNLQLKTEQKEERKKLINRKKRVEYTVSWKEFLYGSYSDSVIEEKQETFTNHRAAVRCLNKHPGAILKKVTEELLKSNL